MDELTAVEQALDGDDTDAMEGALVALWRATRDPVAAELLIELEGQLDARRPEPAGQAWLDVPARRVGARLRWARRGGSGDEIARRLRQCIRLDAPDPRIVRTCLDLLTSSPSARNVPLHDAIWAALEGAEDPDVLAVVRTVPPKSLKVRDYQEEGHPLVACRMAPAFNARLEAFPELASSWTPPVLAPDVQRALAIRVRTRIVELVRPVLPVDDALVGLLEQILANPRDDGLRRVFADRCQEQGDAERGEFVTLQLTDPATRSRAATARMRALEKKHGATWMGAAAGVTLKTSWVFERGFPHAATIGRGSAKAIAMSRGAIGWRTMREVTVETAHETWMLLLEPTSLGSCTILRGDLRRWLRPLDTVWGHRLVELDLVPGVAPSAPLAVPDDLVFPRLQRLRVTPRDLPLADLPRKRPLKGLHLAVPSIPRSALLPRAFQLSAEEAVDWLRTRRERVEGRTELRFVHEGRTVLEVHTKRKGDRWVCAVSVAEDLDGVEGVVEALGAEVIRVSKAP